MGRMRQRARGINDFDGALGAKTWSLYLDALATNGSFLKKKPPRPEVLFSLPDLFAASRPAGVLFASAR